ncbi:MAG: hypothetical protein WCD80_14740 [Desulfobaccales bacterium]
MKKMVVAGVIVTSWMLACLLAIAAELPAIPPIPEKFKNIQIVKPNPSVPKEVADFSGEWEGVWKYVGQIGQFTYLSFGQETRRVKLIVYEVSANKIKILYGWGESPFGRGKAGWRLFESDIMDDNGKKRFSFIGAGRMGFYLEDGILKGTAGGYYETEMKRVK